MSRTMIAALTLVAVAACGGGDKGDMATADSLSRDLQLAPVDTTAELNDRPTASAHRRRPRASPTTPSRPAAPTVPSAEPSATCSGARHRRSLAVGTTLTASTNAEIRSHKNKVGDTVTATVATDVKDRSGRVVIPAGSEVVLKVTAIKESENKSDTTGTLTVQPTAVSINGQSYPIAATIEHVNTELQGRGTNAGDIAKPAAGAAAGADGRPSDRRKQHGCHHRWRARWCGRSPARGRDQGPGCGSASGHDGYPVAGPRSSRQRLEGRVVLSQVVSLSEAKDLFG